MINCTEEKAESAKGHVNTSKPRLYRSIPIPGSHHAGKVGIGDLDGDGEYDFVVRTPGGNIDPYGSNHHNGGWGTSRYESYKLRAIRGDGTPMWTYDLGPNIEGGIWYSPMIVYDLDGDGKAEVIAKTSNTDKVFRNEEGPEKGKVTSGPEHLTVFLGDGQGESPKMLVAADWPDRSGFPDYNQYSRNLIGVAHLDSSKKPSIIVVRGTYGPIKVRAYDYAGGKLTVRWDWVSSEETKPGNWSAQGGHSLHAVDLNGDGKDEIVIGSAVLTEVDGKGVGLWTSGKGDIDHTYVGDLDPHRPGLEIYSGLERPQSRPGELVGISMRDARTGEVLWAVNEPTIHIHDEGMVADIDPRFPGAEGWSGEQNGSKYWLHTPDGGEMDKSTFHDERLAYGAVYWDADPQREVIVANQIRDYAFPGATAGAMATLEEGEQIGWADLYGDWREEIIVRIPGQVRVYESGGPGKEIVVTLPPELRIYSTNIPATSRHVTLMQDPLYRTDVAHQAMGYHQIPTTSYWLAAQMNPAPGSNLALFQTPTRYGKQDGQGGKRTSATFSADRTSVTLKGNVWKQWAYPYDVTANTVLEFTLESSNPAEMLGISLDSDGDPNNVAGRAIGFRLGGSEPVRDNGWSVLVTPAYDPSQKARKYQIRVGDYYGADRLGKVSYLGLFVDDDANGKGAATFSNVRLYEATTRPTVSGGR